MIFFCCQLSTFSIMSLGLLQKDFYGCVACVCPTIGITVLVLATLIITAFLMSVMNISFALPIDIYKSLLNSENC